MLVMRIGDIWAYDLRSLYVKGNYNHRVEHWLILDLISGDEYSTLQGYAMNYYRKEDIIIHYLCMETGQESYKVFPYREWGTLDLTGNPFYKKVA